MKKQLSFLLIALIFLLAIVGCSNESTKKDEADYAQRLTYSNLTDETSQKEVKAALAYAGIKAENIDSYFHWVDYYNGVIGKELLTEKGFVTIDGLVPEYDVLTMLDQWDAKNPDFLGYNCRITSFDLMKDSLVIGKPDTTHADWIIFDELALTGSPEKIFNEAEHEQFRTLYAYVPTESTKDIAVHLKNIKEDWKKKEIQFSNDEKTSLISVFFDDEEGYLFIGHIGVLIETEDDKLIFLEKVGMQDPYQALKFNKRVELNDYLMNKYDISKGQPTAKPIIMENDDLLEGYRENPTNPEDWKGESVE